MGDDDSINYRELFLLGLAAVPDLGGPAALLAAILCPDGSQSSSFQNYQAQFQDIMNETEVNDMKGKLSTFAQGLAATKGTDKVNALQHLYYDMWTSYPQFQNPASVSKDYGKQPQNTVALVVVYGTILFTVMADRVRNYHLWYPTAADPGDEPLQDLRTKITELSAKVQADRAAALKWRHDQVHVMEDKTPNPTSGLSEYNWWITDDGDPSFKRSFWGVSGPIGDELSYEEALAYKDHFVDTYDLQLRVNDDKYTYQLDQMLDAARLWRYADPYHPLIATPGFSYSYRMVGQAVTTNNSFFNDKSYYLKHGEINRIKLWWDETALKGIEAFYGGVSGGVHGVTMGRDPDRDLIIDPNTDAFTWMKYRAGDWVDEFVTVPNSRYLASGPGERIDEGIALGSPAPFQPDTSARIAFLAGYNNEGFVTQLFVAWKTGVEHSIDLPLERTPNALPDFDLLGIFSPPPPPVPTAVPAPWWAPCTQCAVLTCFDTHRCASGDVHDYTGSETYCLTMGGTDGQTGWKWCRSCNSICFPGDPPGKCTSASGVHDLNGSGEYTMKTSDDTTLPNSWRFCYQCRALHRLSDQGGPGVCPQGGLHSIAFSEPYSVPVLGAGGPASGDQPNWRRCNTCSMLAYAGDLHCAAGQQHACDRKAMSQLSSPVPGCDETGYQPGWKRCLKCLGLVFYSMEPTPPCAAGGNHDMRPDPKSEYLVPTQPGAASSAGWTWCKNCGALCKNGGTGLTSVCPAAGTGPGEAHATDGSGEYSVAYMPPPSDPS